MSEQINPEQIQNPDDQNFETQAMWETLTDWLKAPVFEDDLEKTRIASILNPILIGAEVIFTIYSVALFFISQNILVPIILVPVIQVVLVSSIIALRRGIVRRTAIVIITIMTLILIIMAGLFGEVTGNPMIPGLLTVIVLAGFVISQRAAIILGILSLIDLVVFSYIDQIVELPKLLTSNEQVYISRLAMVIMMVTVIVAIVVNTYNKLFGQIQESDAALRQTNEELEQIRSYLEDEVTLNTQQLERRSRYLEAAAKVANSSISILNQQEMIEKVAEEISEQFGFYHVGIFLLDDTKEWAALRAASSDGGKIMLARNHRLAVGRQGIVGFVTSMGQPRISQDTGTDRVHSPTEELPDTRSEMALPLIARGKIIGAIDIQDSKPEAFTEDDITVLQAMADNIALALENIRLFEQSQENLEEVQRIYGEFSERAWREAQQKSLLSSYRYFGGAVTKVTPADLPEVMENKVSIPVEVRGVTLGAIEISKGDDSRSWTADELQLLRSLADQLGIALDSARLFNESQLRATTEHTISQINSQLWETMDINSILRTTAQNLRETLALPELTIHMSAPEVEPEPSSNGSNESEDRDRNAKN